MKIQNPNTHLPFTKTSKDEFGNDLYGYRMVDGLEEIVHIPTGKSNMDYYVPENVTNYDQCTHAFKIVNMGLREVECITPTCRLLTSFHPAVNYAEREGKAYIKLANREYEIVF